MGSSASHDAFSLRFGIAHHAADVAFATAVRPWLTFLPLPSSKAGIKRGSNRARAAAKMTNVNFHDLRHLSATIMLASGVDLYVISKILGHSTVRTTERYAHMQVQAQTDALERAFGPQITPKITQEGKNRLRDSRNTAKNALL